MGIEERGSSIKKALRNLCMSNGWSYGVFWRFDPRNRILLTMEDSYYEEHVASVVGSMLLQVHVLGEGKIGEAALDGKYRWIFLETSAEKCKFLDHTEAQVASWDDSEIANQLPSVIKTLAVIPVGSQGVVEFGSTKEILKTPEFLDQAVEFILDRDDFVGVNPPESASSSLNSNCTDLNGLFASLTSSQNSFYCDLSSSWANIDENMRSCSAFDSLPFTGETIDGRGRTQPSNADFITDPDLGSLVKHSIYVDRLDNQPETFGEGLEPALFPASFFDPCQMDDLSQWFTDSSKPCVIGLDAMVCDMSHTLQVDCISSRQRRSDIFSDIQSKLSANSSQSSLSNALNSYGECKTLLGPPNNDQLMAKFEIDIGCKKFGECVDDVMSPVVGKSNMLPVHTGMSISECISGMEGGSVAGQRKGLFSELGLEHLLTDGACSGSISTSYIDGQLPTKKRKIETNQTLSNQIQLSGQYLGVNLMQPTGSGGLKECLPKSQAGLCVKDSYSMDAKSCISGANTQTRSPEEPAKVTKKRARPGESTRPRPKDRQMIADRIKELRDMIPNGTKLSIDALLDRTIKHILFMQNLTKHEDKLKQVDEPKLIGQDNGLIGKGSSNSISADGSGSRGATWAYEVGGTNLFCPIIVEDLSHPGQMLIEMLCEERGYFLEIADIIRGFRLTILKGNMEAKDDKIWAHFIVEGNRHVTRMDVLVSLMQLLQGTSSSGVNTSVEPNEAPLWSNYQQHVVPLPI